MSAAIDDSFCPRCGKPVSVTSTTEEAGDHLAAQRMECPNCCARLVRHVEGHADRGWRLEDEPAADAGFVRGGAGYSFDEGQRS